MMKWFKRVSVALVVATLYLNIGYAVVSMLERVAIKQEKNEARTPLEEVLTVRGNIPDWSLKDGQLVKDEKTGTIMTNTVVFCLMNAVWPVVIVFVGMLWIIAGAWHVINIVFFYIAMGGLAKLFGLA